MGLRFTYYTEKTVSQCMMALNERIHTSSKLEGWTEKSGGFSLAASCRVARRFSRTTHLQAKAERQGSVTIVKGYVSDGVGPRERVIIIVALALVGLLLILAAKTLIPGVVALAVGPLLYIPLTGDYVNSKVLVGEVQRALKAKDSPPVVVKKVQTTKRPTRPTPSKKPVSARK
jgi:hypothetical protein